MFKLMQAILFIGLVVAVTFLGNRILDEADVNFTDPQQLSRQKAVIAENVSQLKTVTGKKADELKKLYKAIKNAENTVPKAQAVQKKGSEDSAMDAGSQILVDENNSLKPDQTSPDAADSEFWQKMGKIRKFYETNNSDQDVDKNGKKSAEKGLIAKSAENSVSATDYRNSFSELSPLDAEDRDLTAQIREYGMERSDSGEPEQVRGNLMAANDVPEVIQERGTSDLENMAIIMELYSKAAAVLDIE